MIKPSAEGTDARSNSREHVGCAKLLEEKLHYALEGPISDRQREIAAEKPGKERASPPKV